MSNTKTISVPHLHATAGYQYVYPSMVPHLEILIGVVYFIDMLKGVVHPLKEKI